jgi:hypothetical protein
LEPNGRTVDFIPVKNYPAEDGELFDFTSAVYIEKLRRIYIFGGRTRVENDWRYNDEIWYIEFSSAGLSPLRAR